MENKPKGLDNGLQNLKTNYMYDKAIKMTIDSIILFCMDIILKHITFTK